MITIVAGPPCAGKSTYVADQAEPGDEVLDWDVIFAEVAQRPIHDRDVPDREAVEAETEQRFRARLAAMSRGWVIRCAPKRQHRAIMRRTKRARSVVLAVPLQECLRRLDQDVTRSDREADASAIRRWWAEYDGPSSSGEERTLAS